MSKAVVNPEDLRRFANDLKRFSDDTRHQMTVLQGRFAGLGQTWRDQEQSKFAEEFEATMKVLARFLRTSDEQIPFLIRKAERIEDYLRQR